MKLLVIEAIRNTVCSVGSGSGSAACAPVNTNCPSATTPHAIEHWRCCERNATSRSTAGRAAANASEFMAQC